VQRQATIPDWGEIEEESKRGPRSLKISPQHAALSGVVLLICLGFNIFHAFFNPHPGFPYDQFWVVTDIVHCYDDDTDCGVRPHSLRVGDRIIKINELSYDEWLLDRYSNPFSAYATGESLLLEVIRNGEILTIDWRIPDIKTHTIIESAIIPFMIYFPFWIVGTVVLFSMRPRDITWRLLILITYLTAIWLSVGVSPTGLSALPRITLQALSWLMAAVYLHFHFKVPEPLIRNSPGYLVPLLYGLTAIFMIMEIFQLLPLMAYIVAAILAFGGSLILVSYRAAVTPAGPNRVTSRIMFSGVFLAIGPALVLSLVPNLLDVAAPNLLAIVVPLLAVAALPFFYLYAIYKRNLGTWEFRINRFLYYYTLFLVIFTILSIVFLVGTRWHNATNDLASLSLVALAAIFLAVVPLHRRFQSFLDRLTYGSEKMPEEIYKKLSTRIPATVDRYQLQSVFDDEIMPNLAVEQSAIYLLTDNKLDTIYELNVTDSQRPNLITDLYLLLERSGQYLSLDRLAQVDDARLQWVRLAIPVTTRIGTEGVWLFGARLPDDFYSHYDIELLESLADQLAVTIENLRLMEQIQLELEERKKAEAQQQQYSERIRLIHQVDRAILSAESPEEIAQAVLFNIPQLMPCHHANVVIFNEMSEEAELIAVIDNGFSDLEQGMLFPLSDFGYIHNIPGGEPLILDDQFGRWQLSGIARFIRDPSVSTGMIVPLIESGKIIGSLNIGTTIPNAYNEEHKKIASEVANSLAVAIQNARLIKTVKEHRTELQRLSSKLITAQEDERKRISYELHDEIGQLLTAISFNMASVDRALPDNNIPVIRESLKDTNDLIEQVMDQVRTLSLELRPSMLQDLGLIPTLRWYLNISAKRLNVKTQLRNDGLDRRFKEEIETALYRIVQEAVTNAVRHGHADEIQVDIACQNGLISLKFDDNGRGFDTELEESESGENEGTGLLGIRERVTNLEGMFKIDSAINRGTSITVVIPVREFHGQN
jgi:signal transduction histidine kinase